MKGITTLALSFAFSLISVSGSLANETEKRSIDCTFTSDPNATKCSAHVTRYGDGEADLAIHFPDKFVRKLSFSQGQFSASDAADTSVRSDDQGEVFDVVVNESEEFWIPVDLVAGE